MREPSAQRAESHERLALTHRRLDAADGAEHASDEVSAQGKPGVGEIAQHLGRHAEHPAGYDAAPGGQVDTVLVPGTKTAGPPTGHVYPAYDAVLTPDVADDVDGTVDEHPPVVGVVALVPQVDPWLDANLAGSSQELAQLVVAEPVEDGERAHVVDVHQIVAR